MKKNLNNAVNWAREKLWKPAVAAGSAAALYGVGAFAAEGDGVITPVDTGIKWKESAEALSSSLGTYLMYGLAIAGGIVLVRVAWKAISRGLEGKQAV